jgi:hypothetical protein
MKIKEKTRIFTKKAFNKMIRIEEGKLNTNNETGYKSY